MDHVCLNFNEGIAKMPGYYGKYEYSAHTDRFIFISATNLISIQPELMFCSEESSAHLRNMNITFTIYVVYCCYSRR